MEGMALDMMDSAMSKGWALDEGQQDRMIGKTAVKGAAKSQVNLKPCLAFGEFFDVDVGGLIGRMAKEPSQIFDGVRLAVDVFPVCFHICF